MASLTVIGVIALAPAPVAPAQTVASPAWFARVPAGLERLRVEVPDEQLSIVLHAVDYSAQRFDLDPAMVLAIIEVESGFDPRAVSPRGAMGLMQLRPSTARAVARELGIPWRSDEALFDPRLNIVLGSGYLRSLLERFDDSAVALAAYNAGPTRVAASHRSSGTVPLGYSERVRSAQAGFGSSRRVGAGDGIS